MGSMLGEMKKIRRHLQATTNSAPAPKSKPAEIGSNEPGTGRPRPPSLDGEHVAKRFDEADNKALRQAPRTFVVPPRTIQLPHQKTSDRKATTLPQTGGKKDLSGYAAVQIPQIDGVKHTVFVKRIGSTAGYAKQELPTSKAVASARHTADSLKSKFESKATSLAPLTPKVFTAFNLSRSVEFKSPDSWVQFGSKLNLSEDGEAYTAIMGIDFGTAYTKASVGFGGDVFIVDWEGVKSGGDKHVFAGEFSLLDDGSCVLGRCSDARRVGTNLKLPFLENAAGTAALVDATVFLALVMRYVRAWWFHNFSGIIRGRRLEWVVNLGAPTTPWQDGDIRGSYERAGKAAWQISAASARITVEDAERALRRQRLRDEGNLTVEIVPEFVAQIASYTRSVQRRPDLHMLMDIGAGTVDVVTFNVHKDEGSGEDKFPIFSGAVHNLGTHFLMFRRFHACASAGTSLPWDDASRLPNAREFCGMMGTGLDQVTAADRAHTIEIAGRTAALLRDTKQRRYRRSPNWTTGIPVFLCGGGSLSTVFSEAPPLAGEVSRVPLPIVRLPLPARLQSRGLAPEFFHRVSVAYGLGIDAMNLGQIIPSGDVTNEVAPRLPMRPHITDWEDG